MIIGGDDLKRVAQDMKIPSDLVGPSSIDLRLGTTLIHISSDGVETSHTAEPGDSFLFVPNGYYVGSSVEYIELPPDISGMIQTRSSAGRAGVEHFSSAFVDQGFRGHLTFEFLARRPVSFGLGVVPVFQLILMRASSPAVYQGRYQDQEAGPVLSRDPAFRTGGDL